MAGTFPNLTSGQVCMYPVTRAIVAPTAIIRFGNDTEQRWRRMRILNAWTFQYTGISAADLATLKTFFVTQKGAFDKSWVLPFNGTSFTAMTFDQDDFTYVETAEAINRFSLSLRCRQVATSGTYASGASAVFPSIRAGVKTQLPFTTSFHFETVKGDMDTGQRHSYANRTAPLGAWTLDFSAITESELNTLIDFFTSMGGSYKEFSFTDPTTGVTHSKCRFSSDELSFRYISAAVRSLSLQIEEYS